MKFLKFLLYLIIILAVAFVLVNVIAPGSKVIERSTTINAPLNKVYSQVADFDNWKKWDPWFNRDTTQVRETYGEMGTEGYGYNWKSDHEQVGNGSMEISSYYENNSGFDYKLNFEGMDETSGTMELEEEDGTTEVTWTFNSEMPFFFKFMNYFMDGMLGPDLEKGLANLKELVENSSDEELGLAAPETPITMGTANGISYVMIREVRPIDATMSEFFGNAYERLGQYCAENGHEIKGPASALYYEWNPEGGTTDVAACFPLSAEPEQEGKEVDANGVKATMYDNKIVYEMIGDYTDENFEKGHEALGTYLEAQGKTMNGPVCEEYIVGPGGEATPDQYVTHIVYYFE